MAHPWEPVENLRFSQCFERARLQPCRKCRIINRALAPEGSFFSEFSLSVIPEGNLLLPLAFLSVIPEGNLLLLLLLLPLLAILNAAKDLLLPLLLFLLLCLSFPKGICCCLRTGTGFTHTDSLLCFERARL